MWKSHLSPDHEDHMGLYSRGRNKILTIMCDLADYVGMIERANVQA